MCAQTMQRHLGFDPFRIRCIPQHDWRMTCCTITLREFAEETLGLFSSCSVNAQAVTLSAISMAEQIRNKQQTLRVVHQLKKVG